jgi:hypothetical protein
MVRRAVAARAISSSERLRKSSRPRTHRRPPSLAWQVQIGRRLSSRSKAVALQVRSAQVPPYRHRPPCRPVFRKALVFHRQPPCRLPCRHRPASRRRFRSVRPCRHRLRSLPAPRKVHRYLRQPVDPLRLRRVHRVRRLPASARQRRSARLFRQVAAFLRRHLLRSRPAPACHLRPPKAPAAARLLRSVPQAASRRRGRRRPQ